MKTIPIRKISTGYTELNVPGQFSIRKIVDVLKGKDIVHDLHKHDFFLILALEKGEGIHEIDFVEYKLKDSSVFILRPGQVHMLTMKAKCTGFIIEFDSAFYQPENFVTVQRWKKAVGKNYCKIEAKRFKKLYSVLFSILDEYNEMQDGYVDAIKANIELFFIDYVRQSNNQGSSKKVEVNYTQERYEELLSLLDQNICSTKNASQYASLMNLSLFQLNSITKSSVDKSVSELINEQIILESKRHLLATSNQINQIAYHLGYEDVSYFIRFFKKHTGHTPEAFRYNFK